MRSVTKLGVEIFSLVWILTTNLWQAAHGVPKVILFFRFTWFFYKKSGSGVIITSSAAADAVEEDYLLKS